MEHRRRFLLAADIDGTMVARGNTLAPSVRTAVRDAMAHGMDIVLVTSRPRGATVPIHRELALGTPMVCLSGTVVYGQAGNQGNQAQRLPDPQADSRAEDLPDHQARLLEHALPSALLAEAHALAVALDPEVDFYLRCEDRYAATSADNAVIRSFVQRSAVAPDECADFARIASRYQSAHRLGIIPSRPALLPILHQRLADCLAGRARVLAHDDLFLSVSPAAGSKLAAVRYLGRHYAYEPEQVLAIGDSEDDEEMIRWAAFGVAMGNGPARVQQAADYVSPPVDQDGFAHAIEAFIAHAHRAAPASAPTRNPTPNPNPRPMPMPTPTPTPIPAGAGTSLATLAGDGLALRYGANPFIPGARLQRRAEDGAGAPTSLLDGHLLHEEKTLSYQNIVDIDATLRLLWEHGAPTVVCTKHTHPAIAAAGDTLGEAMDKLLGTGDSSIYGSVLAFNRPVDAGIVQALGEIFVSVVIAPACTPAAASYFAARRRKTQVLLLPALAQGAAGVPWRERRAIWGGEVAQDGVLLDQVPISFTVLGNTAAPLTDAEWQDLRFGMKIVRHARTNAAVLVRDRQTLAIANAQTTRYWAIELALQRSRDHARGAVLVCDGRFSHRDAFDLAATGGPSLIAAPRGLVREETLDAWARAHGARVVLFSTRLFHA